MDKIQELAKRIVSAVIDEYTKPHYEGPSAYELCEAIVERLLREHLEHSAGQTDELLRNRLRGDLVVATPWGAAKARITGPQPVKPEVLDEAVEIARRASHTSSVTRDNLRAMLAPVLEWLGFVVVENVPHIPLAVTVMAADASSPRPVAEESLRRFLNVVLSGGDLMLAAKDAMAVLQGEPIGGTRPAGNGG